MIGLDILLFWQIKLVVRAFKNNQNPNIVKMWVSSLVRDAIHITFHVLKLNTFVFNKCSEILIFTIISVVKSLKGFGWNNVGPVLQTVAQHYISIGPMYRVIWCFWRRIFKAHQHNATVRPNAVSMMGQRRRLWVNIETVLVE